MKSWSECWSVSIGIATIVTFIIFSERVALWQGGFLLTVNVSDPDRRFDAIAAEAFGDEAKALDAANGLMEWDAKPSREWGETESVWTAEVRVKSSGRHSSLWGELSRFQERHLVVVGYQKDGAIVRKYLQIPESRSAIEMTVDLPRPEPLPAASPMGSPIKPIPQTPRPTESSAPVTPARP